MERFNLENRKEAKKEIAECQHCLNSLLATMKKMRVPKNEWGDNIMVKEYVRRINKAKETLAKECA